MLNGVSRLVTTYGDALKDDAFRDRIGIFSARDISRTARERRAGSLGFAEALLMAYNRKSKAGLSWAKLYGRKVNEKEFLNEEMDTSSMSPTSV